MTTKTHINFDGDAVFDTDPTADGIAIAASEPPFPDNLRIQLSIVVIAIREWAGASYPSQGISLDDFIHRAANNLVADSYSDPNIVFTLSNDADPALDEANALFGKEQVADRFCGIFRMEILTTGATADSIVFGIIEDITLAASSAQFLVSL